MTEKQKPKYKPGDIVWASMAAYGKTTMNFAAVTKPIRGRLTAYRDKIGDPSEPVRYFVPLPQASDTPLWTKACSIVSLDISATRQDSVECYNRRMRKAADHFGQLRDKCLAGIIPVNGRKE